MFVKRYSLRIAICQENLLEYYSYQVSVEASGIYGEGHAFEKEEHYNESPLSCEAYKFGSTNLVSFG